MLFLLPVLYSLLSLAVVPLHRKAYCLLYPCTLLFLKPSWLIEQRYTLIPFTLFVLFRCEQKPWVEYAQLGLGAILALLLLLNFYLY